MCTQYLNHIHPSTPSSHILPPLTGANPQTGPIQPSYFPFL
jgi:hypothetical protein